MAHDPTQPLGAPKWSWKTFSIWCVVGGLLYGLFYISLILRIPHERPQERVISFVIGLLISVPFSVAFYYGLYVLIRRWINKTSRGQVKSEILSEKAESLQDELDKDFFTNLIRINFKYLDKYYLQT